MRRDQGADRVAIDRQLALLRARTTLGEQLGKLQKQLVSLARNDVRARLLMTTPGVGVLVALTYAAAIDDPARCTAAESGRIGRSRANALAAVPQVVRHD